MEQIGTKIQTLRKNKNITQAQLAEALSVSSQSVSKWENHLSLPDISLLPIIARFFGATMDELFGYRLDALSYKERFIRFMADNGVLQFGSFPLRCGRISPYFINAGNYKSSGQIAKLGEFYAACIRENNIDSRLLVGNTASEIPLMIATGMVLFNQYGLDVPYSIDGAIGKHLEPNDKITLIKDTLTTGHSLRKALRSLEQISAESGYHVIVSVDRMERGEDSNLSAGKALERTSPVKIHALVTVDDIIRAMENGVIGGKEHLDAMKQYRKEYGGKET